MLLHLYSNGAAFVMKHCSIYLETLLQNMALLKVGLAKHILIRDDKVDTYRELCAD